MIRLILVSIWYLDVRIGKLIQESKNSTPRRERTRARPTPTLAGSGEPSEVRHVQETARQEVDLSSSCLKDGSKRGLNGSLWPLSLKHQHIYTFIYNQTCTETKNIYTKKNTNPRGGIRSCDLPTNTNAWLSVEAQKKKHQNQKRS